MRSQRVSKYESMRPERVPVMGKRLEGSSIRGGVLVEREKKGHELGE